MDEKRRGEIAYEVLRYRVRHEEIRLNNNTRRDLGSIAKEMGIPFQELKIFTKELISDALDEALDD